MTVRLIVAMSSEGVIGVGNELPWRLKDDLEHFKRLTLGRTVVMGANTFESIGRPLPNRNNIVVSRTRTFSGDNVIMARTPPVLEDADIIGGVHIYRHYLSLGLVDELFVTFVDACVSANHSDKLHYFPMKHFENFIPTFLERKVERNESNDHSFKIVKYSRR